MDLANTAILITGASRGIGAATARHLAKSGAALALTARDETRLNELAKACREAGARDVVALPGDITDQSFAESLAPLAAERLGQLNALFNNAGVLDVAAFDQADLTKWNQILDVNFRSWMHVTQPAIEFLKRNHESAIINLCSVAGRLTYPGGGIYTATKHAVHAWSQCMFEDFRESGMKVCAIYPGFVRTDMTSYVDGDHAKMIQPDDIAQTVSFILQFPTTGCPTEIVIRPQLPLN